MTSAEIDELERTGVIRYRITWSDRVLCWLGWHEWQVADIDDYGAPAGPLECMFCGRRTRTCAD